jgi:hypothetical protein
MVQQLPPPPQPPQQPQHQQQQQQQQPPNRPSRQRKIDAQAELRRRLDILRGQVANM